MYRVRTHGSATEPKWTENNEYSGLMDWTNKLQNSMTQIIVVCDMALLFYS